METASGCSRLYVGTYPLLHRDVSDATSGRNFFYVVSQNCKKEIENAQHRTGEKFFVQCFLIFSPKIPLKHLYFADFMAIYGRLWQFLKKNNYNTADRKTLILFNIPSVAKTKRVRHCLITHPSYYNLVYSLAGNSLLILRSILYFSSK